MDVKNFRFKDKDGNVLYEFPITGVAPDITVTASVDNNVGTPSVSVTKTGENDTPTYQLDFKNLKGATGAQGIQGVQGVQGVQGPPVTLDTSASTTSHNGVENQAITNYVNGKLTTNPTADYIDLTAYTSDSPYTTLNDGYVWLQCEPGTSTQSVVGVVGSGVNFIARSNGTLRGNASAYIKKGMSLYNLSLIGNPGYMRFYPCS